MIDISKLSQCLEESGIYISVLDFEDESDIDLRDFVDSSIQFISTIINIESAFNIEIPDDYLTINTFASLRGLVDIITELQKNGNQKD